MTAIASAARRVAEALARIRAVAAIVAAVALLAALSPATANETVTYSYDALGRLVQVARSGTVNNGTTASYTYDAADNRTNVTVSTAGGGVTITVNPATLPGGTVGTAYSQTISATGGTGPYTFARTAGTLPAGLTLSSAGLLSGTPSAAGTYSFTVTATDSASNTGSRAYSMSIAAGGVTITVNPATLPGGTVGTAYSQTISASGGTSPYTFARTAGTLPAGLSLSSAGLLSGTPTTAATYSFTVTATDSASNTGSRAYSMSIASGGGGGTCSGVSFAVNDVTVVEGDVLVFTVTKSGTTSGSCSISYATADGTATAPTYYTATSGTLTFSAAQTSQTVSVTTNNLGRLNATLRMYLNLSNATSGATISDSQGIGSIQASGGDPNPCPLC